MKIDYQIIPHSEQRYDTVGDYWIDNDGTWHFRVSQMSDPRYMQLVFHHELIEASLARANDIQIEDIDRFDVEYENARTQQNPNQTAGPWKGNAPCGCAIEDEPGDDPHCPVFAAHQVATHIERIIADELGVDWEKYNAEVESL